MMLIKRDHNDEMYTRKGCREIHDTLKKIYPTHVIKLGFAQKTYPTWQYKYRK